MSEPKMAILNPAARTCTACGKDYTSELNEYHQWCPTCRTCPNCGSEFMVGYRRVIPMSKTTEFRCLTCLGYRVVEEESNE